jgi:hypothetical protein
MADEKPADTPAAKSEDKAAAKSEDKAAAKSEDKAADTSSALKLLESAAKAALPVVVSAVVSVGFVAFAGKAILWTRFNALQVPGDQVVKAVPQGEAVAIGASLLLIFGALGVLAALGVYLVDRAGRATALMSRGLLVILLIEAVVAIWHTEGKSLTSSIVATEFVVLAVGTILWATFVAGLTEERKAPGARGEEGKGEYPCGPFFYFEKDKKLLRGKKDGRPSSDPKNGITTNEKIFVPLIAALLAGAAFGAALLLGRGAGWAWVSAMGMAIAAFFVGVLSHCIRFWNRRRAQDAEEEKKARRKAAEEARKKKKKAKKRRKRQKKLRARLIAQWKAVCTGCGPAPTVVFLSEGASPPEKPPGGGGADELTEQSGVDLAHWGVILVLALAALVVAVPSVILQEWWLAIALGAVALLGAALWQIASLSKEGFVWYGLAVFISVPLFGTAMLMASNADEPKVQPMAMIRSTDGPDEAIQGLYVTEADDRVYFANVATEGCKNRVRDNSGRLLWVPKKEVLAMSVGPLQGVEEAGKTALEMSYDLTPAVETGRGPFFSPGQEESAVEESVGTGVPLDTRLANVGSAVRPYFGAGLRIEPEVVSPGGEATLRMTAPNEEEEVEGFGESREHHNLRIGGRVADIAKERSGAGGAEYIETENGRLINLDKKGAYVLDEDDDYVLATEDDDGDVDNRGDGISPYVRLDDPAVLSVETESESESEPEPADEEPVYVPIEELDGGVAQVDSNAKQAVSLAGGSFEGRSWDAEPKVELNGRPLLRQAWHKDHIRFNVPEDAQTSVVTVECDQLAGSPLLQVSRAPQARIAVEMKKGTPWVKFNGRASGTAQASASSAKANKKKKKKEPLTRRWKVDGILAGHDETIHHRLEPRMAPYEIELTVIDKAGNTDVAKLQFLRLPARVLRPTLNPFRQQRIKRAMRVVRKAIKGAAEAERPKGVEIDSYTDKPGKPMKNLGRSLDHADGVRERLLHDFDGGATSPEASEDLEGVSVEELAHGERCSIHPNANPANLHVDLLLLHDGVIVRPAEDCRPQDQQSATWRPPPGKTSG